MCFSQKWTDSTGKKEKGRGMGQKRKTLDMNNL